MKMREIANELKKHERIAVIGHVSPDGDAIGSVMAVRHALITMGKQAAAVLQDAPPTKFQFLPEIQAVVRPEHVPFEPDCVLYMDVSSPDRAGTALELQKNIDCRLLVDHHGTNDGFGCIAVIRKDASSTGELAMELIEVMGASIDETTALYLYVAMASDTGNFSFSCTTPESLRYTARCLETGLDLADVNRRLFHERTVVKTKLIGAGLSHMEMTEDGRIAWIRITKDMMASCAAVHEDVNGLVNYLNEVIGVEACFIVEQDGDKVNVSIRSNGKVDVSLIAQSMGGGGHDRAAGILLDMPIDRAADTVRCALQSVLGG